MSKHTPGPWTVLPSVDPGQFVILTRDGVRQDIAVTYGFPETPREANARLIAAAPDLLEALREIADTVVYAPEGGHEEVAECVRIARCAIAKATGESA